MRRSTSVGLLALTYLLISNASAMSQEAIALPDQFKVAQPNTVHKNFTSNEDRESRAPLEKPSAVLGTGDMIVSPIFTGSDGNDSFLRLVNADTTSATTTIRVVGTPSGDLYGTANISVPSGASPQFRYSDILDEANAGELANDDLGYSFYLSSTSALAGFQHVIFNNSNQFFENMSICAFDGELNYSPLDQILVNIHTTNLSSFPSLVFTHNFFNQSRNVNVDVYEGASGTLMGSIVITLDPNTSYATPFEWFQDQVNWEPTSSEFHGNLFFSMSDSSEPPITIGHAVQNESLNALLNLTQICAINFGTNVLVGGGSTYTTPDFIESRITSDFEGWSGDTVFVLANDQVWQQTDFSFETSFQFNPDAIIFLDGSTYMMSVDGVDSWVDVRRLICTAGSGGSCAGGNGSTAPDFLVGQISGTFDGFSNGTTFNLTNGQVWEQTSFDISVSISINPNVVIYDSGLNFTMAVEGEDDWVTVERIQ